MKKIVLLFLAFCFAELLPVNGQENTSVRIKTTHYSTNKIPGCNYGVAPDTIRNVVKKKLPKEIKKYLEEMKFIEGGKAEIHRDSWLKPTENDSSLLFFNHDKIISTVSFLLSDAEVTNGRYREFVNWVRDSVARAFLAKTNPKYYLNETTKLLNIAIPVDWRDSLLISYIYHKESERFYERPEIDSRRLNYSYTDETGKTVSLNVYPDTLSWVHDFSYSFNEPMTQMYFWHPAYDNYPVVGVSWLQAKAYCDWKTKQLKSLLKKNGLNLPVSGYRLPNNYEWEYAATRGNSRNKYERYPEKEPWIVDKDGKYHANYGSIADKNNVYIRFNTEDDAFHTIIVKHYEPNYFGLYDMAGNVSEWTDDSPPPLSLKSYFGCFPGIDTLPEADYSVTEKDDEHSLLKRICEIAKRIPGWEEIDTNYKFSRKRISADVKNLLHDRKILNNNDSLRTVKGGSWADPPVYMITGMNGVWRENKSSCKIGFRPAMSLSKEMIPYFYNDSKPKVIKKMEKEQKRKRRTLVKGLKSRK